MAIIVAYQHLWLITNVWNRQPALSEIVCGHFRFTLSGEHALFVALDTYDALAGLEICKIPHLFADKVGELVYYLMISLQALDLVLFREHHRRCIMKTRDGIGPILGEHDGFAWLRATPARQLGTQAGLGDF